ncbi:hypothetical protein ACA910_001842 [Epithemia clementina (nom. ined.)]
MGSDNNNKDKQGKKSGTETTNNKDSSTANSTTNSTTTTTNTKPFRHYQNHTQTTTNADGSSSTIVTDKPTPLHRWIVGLLQASCFSMVYLVAPFYMISVVLLWCYNLRSATASSPPLWLYWYTAPMAVSALLPPMASPFVLSCLQPMLEYFDSYEQIHETSPVDVLDQMLHHGTNYILAAQPHGVISYTGMMSAIAAPPETRGLVPTAVADAVLYTPILKHVLGIFGLQSASKTSLVQTLKNKGVRGTVVLYVGGMAELFLSSQQEERLFVKHRKGFIKLSLQTGVDIVPLYLFGNTSVLSVVTHGFLATLSRKLQVSLTYFWGKWYLPIPRNECKLLYVSGQPVGIPHIPDPTPQDIDKYHALYCQQVQRLYDTYKERVPEYKHKKLQIV